MPSSLTYLFCPRHADSAPVSALETSPIEVQPTLQKSSDNSFLNHYGICSLNSPIRAPCFLPPVLRDCSPGQARSLGRGTNADCHFPTTGCSQSFRHSTTTDNAWIQSKVLLVLYDVSTSLQIGPNHGFQKLSLIHHDAGP